MKAAIATEWAERQIRQKQTYIETFHEKRPDDAADKRRDIQVLAAIHADYRRGMGADAPPPLPEGTADTSGIKATDIVDWCGDAIDDLYDWLDKHDGKRNRRPDMEIDAKRDQISTLKAIRQDYRAAIEKRKSRG